MALLSSKSRESAELAKQENQREIQQAVLLTVLYADLFDYPLTQKELYRRLIDCAISRRQFQRAVDSLTGTYLDRSGDYIVWRNRAYLGEQRRRRECLSSDIWPAAERYGRWLRWIPFMRMVAVSGSLAINNATSDSDIDLFCITDARRLWFVRLWLVCLSRLTRLFSSVFPRYVCPNYLLTLEALQLEDKNLFTAYEAIQAVPLWGEDVYRRFLQANKWRERFLPHSCEETSGQVDETPQKPLLVRGCEWLLNGRAGDVLERGVFQLFLAGYRRRAEQRGWAWCQLQHAYRRDRYTIPEGGYVHVVRQYFRERVQDCLGESVAEERLSWLFPEEDEQKREFCYDWVTLFEEEYGRID